MRSEYLRNGYGATQSAQVANFLNPSEDTFLLGVVRGNPDQNDTAAARLVILDVCIEAWNGTEREIAALPCDRAIRATGIVNIG